MGRGGTKWGVVGRSGGKSRDALPPPSWFSLSHFMDPDLNSAPIFSGEFRHALDPKNRVTVPACWRKTEADVFHVMPDSSKSFLRAMPPEEFRAVGAKKIESVSGFSAQQKKEFLRMFYSQALLVTLDKQGRLLVPEAFGKTVGLSEEVVLVGAMDTFELWSPKAWAETKQTISANYQDLAAELGL